MRSVNRALACLALAILLAPISCKTTGSKPSDSKAAADQKSGERISLFVSSYDTAEGAEQTFGWFVRKMFDPAWPPADVYKKVSKDGMSCIASPQLEADYCDISASRNEFFSCGFNQKSSEAECSLFTASWPDLFPQAAEKFGQTGEALKLVKGSSLKVGGKSGFECNKAAGTWACKFLPFKGHVVGNKSTPSSDDSDGDSDSGDDDASWSDPQPTTATKVPTGAEDEFGNLLPATSAEHETWLPMGYTNLNKYRISDSDLALYVRTMADTDAAPPTKGTCRPGEMKALEEYAGSAYARINKALRRLAIQDEEETKLVNRNDELAILATASALNCMPKSTPKIVVRGANLDEAKLKRYVKGQFIIENAFTSTTIGTRVVGDFAGNVEFRIIKAKGVDLADVSGHYEESELLIMTGTLFKVLDHRKQGSKHIIELQQLP